MCPRPPLRKEQVFVLGPCVPTGGRVLQIPQVRAEDAGRYSCKASNEVGEDWLHYELQVLSEWPGPG